jgi:hypothetical protein
VFKAAQVKNVVGAAINVTPVLSRLVEEEGHLTRVHKKRYGVPPPKIVDRADWTS